MRDIVVFSGSAHRELAARICAGLSVELSPAVITRFSNDCLQAQLLANCRQRDVYIVQPLVPPTQEHLMELLLMIDAARGASAAQITAVIPHYAYARSDKKDASRISLGGRLVADMLVAAGVDRVLTMTLHAPQVHGFFSVPVDHLTAIGVLAEHFRDHDLRDAVVVSPDLGNAKTATQFARLLGLPVAAGSKRRLGDDRVVIDSIVGDVAGKRAIVLDDEIATGGSIVELLDRLKEQGCREAAVACTHGLFAGRAVERLRDHPMITEVVTTDTVPAPVQLARPAHPLGGRPVRRGDLADPRRRVGQQPLRRRRPGSRPAPPHALRRRPRVRRPVLAALAADVVGVLLFAAVGRSSHDEGLTRGRGPADRLAVPGRGRRGLGCRTRAPGPLAPRGRRRRRRLGGGRGGSDAAAPGHGGRDRPGLRGRRHGGARGAAPRVARRQAAVATHIGPPAVCTT